MPLYNISQSKEINLGPSYYLKASTVFSEMPIKLAIDNTKL